MRWYRTPIQADLPPEYYRDRAARFHNVALQLPDASAADRFEAMAEDSLAIADQLERTSL